MSISPRRARVVAPLALLTLALVAPDSAIGQEQSRVSISFEQTEVPDVLAFFARYSGRSIVAGAGVAGVVTAEIENQPWDVALQAILTSHGLAARELPSGIIVVESPTRVVENPGPLVSRVFRLNYVPASEVEPVVRAMLSERGTVAALASVNALVVTDEPRVLERIAAVVATPR